MSQVPTTLQSDDGDEIIITSETAKLAQEYLLQEDDELGDAIFNLMKARRTHAALLRTDDPLPSMVARLLAELDEAAVCIEDLTNNIRWLLQGEPITDEEDAGPKPDPSEISTTTAEEAPPGP